MGVEGGLWGGMGVRVRPWVGMGVGGGRWVTMGVEVRPWAGRGRSKIWCSVDVGICCCIFPKAELNIVGLLSLGRCLQPRQTRWGKIHRYTWYCDILKFSGSQRQVDGIVR